jgi:hypothetical protein
MRIDDTVEATTTKQRIAIVDLVIPDVAGKCEIVGDIVQCRATASAFWIEYTRVTDFDIQKAAFLAIPGEALRDYVGRYVVSRNGHIVASDTNPQALAARFFASHGRVPAYITRIGEPIPRLIIDTPFFD